LIWIQIDRTANFANLHPPGIHLPQKKNKKIHIYNELAALARALGCGQAARLTMSTDAGCP
jgi:hypothetical protein